MFVWSVVARITFAAAVVLCPYGCVGGSLTWALEHPQQLVAPAGEAAAAAGWGYFAGAVVFLAAVGFAAAGRCS